MAPKVLGIDISDNSTSVVSYSQENALHFPTAIGRMRNEDRWVIGEDAFAMVLDGRGVKTDKLLKTLTRGGSSTLNGIKYTGVELMTAFLQALIDCSMEEFQSSYPEKIVVSIPSINRDIVEKFFLCFKELGYLRNSIHIISRCESFIYYVISQKKEIWNNQVGLFALADAKLTYYELRAHRSAKYTRVYAESEGMDEGFNLELIDTAAGAKLADKILISCAERLMKKKIFSTIMLTGKGFERIDWAPSFKKFICSGKKVFVDRDLFAKGSCYRGVDLALDKPIFNFTCICEGRLDTSISLNMKKRDTEYVYSLAEAGDTWYDSEKKFRVIVDGDSSIDLILSPVDTYKKKKIVKIPLDFIPQRPPKTVRVELEAKFNNGRTLLLGIKDTGFGEIYPSSGKSILKEVELWD